MCSAWVPGSAPDGPDWEIEIFSSDSTLASPGFRASFVLRDRGHIKAQFLKLVGLGSLPARTRFPGRFSNARMSWDVLQHESPKQGVCQCTGGQCTDTDRRGGGYRGT